MCAGSREHTDGSGASSSDEEAGSGDEASSGEGSSGGDSDAMDADEDELGGWLLRWLCMLLLCMLQEGAAVERHCCMCCFCLLLCMLLQCACACYGGGS